MDELRFVLFNIPPAILKGLHLKCPGEKPTSRRQSKEKQST